MNTLTEHDPKLRRLAELIGEIQFGVLTTVGEDGSMWSWPVSTQQADPDGELWFFTKLDSPMARELGRHRRVSLCYAKPVDRSYVSIIGTCELISDGTKAGELWDPSYQDWLPGGPRDPSLLLVRVTVERAEYWDAPSATWPLEAGFSALECDGGQEDQEHHARIDRTGEEGPLIIRTGPCQCCGTKHARCYHRSFPTEVGLGETPRHAALDLLRRLHSEKDTLPDRWHLEKVEAAIAEIRAFLGDARAETRSAC